YDAEEEPGRHQDGRPQHAAREVCEEPGHAGLRHEHRHDEPEDDEHAGVGVAGAEVGALEVVGGHGAADDAEQEASSVGDGDYGQQHHSRGDGLGVAHEGVPSSLLVAWRVTVIAVTAAARTATARWRRGSEYQRGG